MTDGRITTEDIAPAVERWMVFLSGDPATGSIQGGELMRPIVISPYYGHYGLAGYILAIQGSPVRAAVWVDLHLTRCIDGYIVILPTSGAKKTTKINRPSEYSRQPAPKSKRQFYEDTLAILAWLGLPADPGGYDDLRPVQLTLDEAPYREHLEAVKAKRPGDTRKLWEMYLSPAALRERVATK